jgi:uncharacterized membrane protein
VQTVELGTAAVAVALFSGVGPTAHALAWGTLAGVGSALGTLALYHGLSIGRMSAVATLSAVLTAVIPALYGVAAGNRLSTTAAAGIVIAVPAIALVSWQPVAGASLRPHAARDDLLYGGLAGLAFAVLFIALDRAGTHSGAWPLVPGQAVGVVLIVPVALRGRRRRRRSAAPGPAGRTLGLALGSGVLGGVANLVFLAATGRGELSIVAVITALYPATTVVLARVVLGEYWTRVQVAGLLTAVAAIVLVSLG